MGTRHLTCVVKDGKFKVAQYGQWDGYLRGQGHNICSFVMRRLQTPEGLATFKERVDQVVDVDDAHVEQLWNSLGVTVGANMDQVDEFNKQWPNLNRDYGARILDYVYWNNGARVHLEVEFAGDSLFCEWCYVIDLDNDTLEIYQGFNKEPVPEGERFHGFERGPNEKYHPVKLWHTVALSEINENTIPSLLKREEAENAAEET